MLTCITRVWDLKEPVLFRPLQSFPVIRDLVVDMTQFFKQYESIKPYLINDEPPPEKERLQSPEERDNLDGLYECILCGCCTSQCPSSRWNPAKLVGPTGLLQAERFIVDSRDRATQERLDDLNDVYRLFRCRTIMNCTEVCLKSLAPSRAIEKIRLMMAKDPLWLSIGNCVRAEAGTNGNDMTFVVTESCIKCKYTHCVDVCPTDAFREGANCLVIEPDDCINCALCVVECPVDAIFPESEVPNDQIQFIALNVELAMVWKTISCKKAPLSDAEEWGEVKDKLDLLER